jgi:hypothetical protein
VIDRASGTKGKSAVIVVDRHLFESVPLDIVTMMLRIFIVLFCINAALASRVLHVSETPPDKPGFTNTFYDSFSGSAGSLPSASNWIFDMGTSYPHVLNTISDSRRMSKLKVKLTTIA